MEKIYIPLGSNCSVAKQLATHKLRYCSLPFDWCKLDMNKLIQVLQNNFMDFEKFEYIRSSENYNLLDENKFKFIPNTSSLLLKNIYGIKFAHLISENNPKLFLNAFFSAGGGGHAAGPSFFQKLYMSIILDMTISQI